MEDEEDDVTDDGLFMAGVFDTLSMLTDTSPNVDELIDMMLISRKYLLPSLSVYRCTKV